MGLLIRSASGSAVLAGIAAQTSEAQAEVVPQSYDYRYQLYQESGDRIRVESHYLKGEVEVTDGTSLTFQWLNDTISGASPSGVERDGPNDFLSELSDVREAVLVAISQKVGNHELELEATFSEESDYVARGIALKDTLELNQKNTTLTLGLNYSNDRVDSVGLGERRKESFDLFAGVSQILDKNTLLTANLTLGQSNGYLNDPYKRIQRTNVLNIEVVPGLFVPVNTVNVFRENRPDERHRAVLQLGLRHYLPGPDAALDLELRFSEDDFGISSQTAQLEWRQAIGDSVTVTPFLRYYQQTAADFFTRTLDGRPDLEPLRDPTGGGPNFSADFRLSEFSSFSYGVRAQFDLTDYVSASLAYERYSQSGGSDGAPSQAFIDADIFTAGISLRF